MSLQGFYTTKGLTLAAKIAAGTKLTVTKVTAGSGTTVASAAVLEQEKQTLPVGEAAVSGQCAVLPVTLAEANVSAAYALIELGVYASDPTEGEILYQVFRLNEARSVQAGGENVYRFYLKQAVGAAGVTVACSPAGLLIDEDLKPLRTTLAKKPDAVLEATYVYVSASGNDTTGTGSINAPFRTVQAAVDSLPRCLTADTTIKVLDGAYEENVVLKGFFGGGSLTLSGSDGVSVRTLQLNGCACRVYLSNLQVTGTGGASGYNWSVYVGSCAWVSMDHIKCTGTVASQYVGALYLIKTPLISISNTTVSNKAIALDVVGAAVYLNNTVTGTDNTVAIRCGSGWGNAGGYVQKGGAAIAGEEQKGYGGQIW